MRTSQRTRQEFSSVVPIRPDGSAPPLFFIHGVGGVIPDFGTLLDKLDPRHPVYGIQAQAFDRQVQHFSHWKKWLLPIWRYTTIGLPWTLLFDRLFIWWNGGLRNGPTTPGPGRGAAHHRYDRFLRNELSEETSEIRSSGTESERYLPPTEETIWGSVRETRYFFLYEGEDRIEDAPNPLFSELEIRYLNFQFVPPPLSCKLVRRGKLFPETLRRKVLFIQGEEPFLGTKNSLGFRVGDRWH